MISVIVPIYNEEKSLLVDRDRFRELSAVTELIFVDGGSSDRSREIASRYGRVLASAKGRALQMNSGARAATNDILLFLHADTAVGGRALSSIENCLNGGCVGGCLTQRLSGSGLVYRLIEGFGNLRARLSGIFYGDQAIFVKRPVFEKIGGFPRIPVMEDAEFSRRLRAAGKTVVLADKVFVSPRRWKNKGFLRTVLLYSFLNFLFLARVSFERISYFYEDLR